MSFEFLFGPVERLDDHLTGLFTGAPLLVALAIALALGLRHASDPDHLVAVTSLMARDDSDSFDAARIGAWWGLGHAATLLAVGIPLVVFKSALPAWMERGAELGVGAIILLLAGRVVWKWVRGDYRTGRHDHLALAAPPAAALVSKPAAAEAGSHDGAHRHLHRGDCHGHPPTRERTPAQAFGIGVVHGLAGTGAIVVLLIAALPSRTEAVAALAVFAPASVLSMSALTAAFAWVLTRPIVEPVYRGLLIPLLGAFGMLFGLWYVGIGA